MKKVSTNFSIDSNGVLVWSKSFETGEIIAIDESDREAWLKYNPGELPPWMDPGEFSPKTLH